MEWRQPPGRQGRGTLIFAGGRGDFIEKYLEPLAHWHGAGWNVASFDWRGQGDSRGDIDGGHLDSLDPLVEDLAALAGEIRSGWPGPHVAIGHSMGGHVLLRAIAEKRVTLDAAVLVAPMLMINSASLPPWAAWWTASAASAFGLRHHPLWRSSLAPAGEGSSRQRILTSCPERYADELWWWERQPGFDLGAPSWGWLDAAYRSCSRLTPELLKGVDTPVLIVATEADRLVSPEAIHRAAEAIPKARLKMFETAGHEILRETDPVRTEALEAIDGFLDEIAGR
jgi:lysophospholipase